MAKSNMQDRQDKAKLALLRQKVYYSTSMSNRRVIYIPIPTSKYTEKWAKKQFHNPQKPPQNVNRLFKVHPHIQNFALNAHILG